MIPLHLCNFGVNLQINLYTYKFTMNQLNLPSYPFRIKKIEDKTFIFDALRRKYVSLTPEEWVRQHFTTYLIQEKHFPAGRMGNEISVSLNGQKRRCDTVVYDGSGTPAVIVEYKAADVALTQDVFDQIYRYNIVLRVRYLIVTNGMDLYCCRIDYNTLSAQFINEIPDYADL